MWKLGRETVRLLIKDEVGVIKIRLGRKKVHTAYSVPESVARANPHAIVEQPLIARGMEREVALEPVVSALRTPDC